MKSNYLFVKLGLFFLFGLTLFSCTKSSHEVNENLSNEEKIKVNSKKLVGNSEFKFNNSDSVYISALKGYAQLNNANNNPSEAVPQTTNPCANSAGQNTYGYFYDDENIIVHGSYISASSYTYESNAANCFATQNIVNNARNYLYGNGYHDIVGQIEENDPVNAGFKIVHAANTLVWLKYQMGTLAERGSQERAVNCVLQAIGYAAIAELSANWATASRQYLLKAVGKLASRYLGWFGAAIALGSFIDCMWG